MKKTPIQTERAPSAIGPYSQAIATDSLLFISGQIPLDPQTGNLVSDHIEDQIIQVLQNLSAVAEAGGCTLQHTLKLTVFLTDLKNFALVNEKMSAYFEQPYPARAAVEVSRLPKDVLVEMDAILTKV